MSGVIRARFVEGGSGRHCVVTKVYDDGRGEEYVGNLTFVSMTFKLRNAHGDDITILGDASLENCGHFDLSLDDPVAARLEHMVRGGSGWQAGGPRTWRPAWWSW